jgi:large subunit ribosomal protein L31
MREGIHPEYVEAKVVCSCGNTFTTRSTKDELHVELCNKCHPFYTGQQKFVDTGGRVQRFADKFGNAAESVMAKQAADREARQKAAEEAAEAARTARAGKDARKAEKSAKHETAEATASGAADAVGDEKPEPAGDADTDTPTEGGDE